MAMTREEKEIALYCLKASSDYHSEVCEECIKYPNCDHTIQDDVTETIIKALEQEPCEDALSLEVYKQTLWERDIAIAQLKELGYGFGEKIRFCEDAVSRKEVKEALRNRIRESVSDCINALPSVTPTQKWIFVSEELPKSDDDVLVTNGKGMYIGWIDPTDKRWRVDSESEYYMENVVAWMPLPKLYKKEIDV